MIRLLVAILATADGRWCRWEVRCVDHVDMTRATATTTRS
jgi:hypothetical protein